MLPRGSIFIPLRVAQWGTYSFLLIVAPLRCGFLNEKMDFRDRSNVGLLILTPTYYGYVSINCVFCNRI